MRENIKDILLNNLEDIEGLREVSFFPLGAGWWFIIISALFFFLLFIAIRFYFKRKKSSLKYTLLAEIKSIENIAREHKFLTAKDLGKLSYILRRYALYVYGRNKVAGLEGDDWVDFLEKKSNLNWQDQKKVLLYFAYDKEDKRYDLESVLPFIYNVKEFIKKC